VTFPWELASLGVYRLHGVYRHGDAAAAIERSLRALCDLHLGACLIRKQTLYLVFGSTAVKNGLSMEVCISICKLPDEDHGTVPRGPLQRK
jgi:hypothetical protein